MGGEATEEHPGGEVPDYTALFNTLQALAYENRAGEYDEDDPGVLYMWPRAADGKRKKRGAASEAEPITDQFELAAAIADVRKRGTAWRSAAQWRLQNDKGGMHFGFQLVLKKKERRSSQRRRSSDGTPASLTQPSSSSPPALVPVEVQFVLRLPLFARGVMGGQYVTLDENGKKDNEDMHVATETLECAGASGELLSTKRIVNTMIEAVEKARARTDSECIKIFNDDHDTPIWCLPQPHRGAVDAFPLVSSDSLKAKHKKFKQMLLKDVDRRERGPMKIYVTKPAGNQNQHSLTLLMILS
jgi:hypothetical protein